MQFITQKKTTAYGGGYIPHAVSTQIIKLNEKRKNLTAEYHHARIRCTVYSAPGV